MGSTKRLCAASRPSSVGTLGLGAASGLLASSVCFPLDTVRRQMQMRACTYTGQIHAISTIWQKVSSTYIIQDLKVCSAVCMIWLDQCHAPRCTLLVCKGSEGLLYLLAGGLPRLLQGMGCQCAQGLMKFLQLSVVSISFACMWGRRISL